MQRSDPHTQTGKIRQIATLGAIGAAIIGNLVATLFPPSGTNVGQLANTLLSELLILPANYAFAIWGLIYLGLIGFGLYQAQPSQRYNSTLQSVGYLVVVASIAQILWIFLFQAQWFAGSVVAMLAILIPLISVYGQLNIGQPVNRESRWLVHLPFSIYLGWISVATVVNIAAALYVNGWQGWGLSDLTWTSIMVLITAGLAIGLLWRRNDLAFSGVIVWALLAIGLRPGKPLLLVGLAVGLAIGLGLLIGLRQGWSKTR
uniref:Tryptophan-rich sensory protein n=1 Tax=Cyanothece sp. (strain PCC 7425 / ATCC 29141) TaxID=395961 RepID=B8HKU1_CYAP4